VALDGQRRKPLDQPPLGIGLPNSSNCRDLRGALAALADITSRRDTGRAPG
jgi:hypothetical protein